ncbi:MAG TPA: type III polyketide synthase [Kiritimatiellia bacterium]|nr:type III polyketide synthase [Kiritimatiellia bacterium]
MSVYIHALETAVPGTAYTQDHALACMQRWLRDPRLRRLAGGVYKHSGIAKRHSVLPDFAPGAEPRLFHEEADGSLREPSTGARNRIFEQTYPDLARDAVARAFEAAPHLAPSDVTHVVTVSCTGFTNPGPDLFLTHAFGLNPAVERYHLGFMGCYAAFPALRMADQFCRANPDAVVLVLCVELCSLHLQIKPTADALLANALFADGAAAALVSACAPPPDRRVFALDGFATRLLPEGERDMAWTIGDRGFDMTLSAYVPKLLSLNARPLLADMLGSHAIDLGGVAAWAVHPGGRAILDGVEESLALAPDALAASRAVLSAYGNMSSATVLFVLHAMMQAACEPEDGLIAALAFGPGLTVELGVLRAVGPVREPAARHPELAACPA